MRFLKIACFALFMAVFMSVSVFAATGCDLTEMDGFFVKGGNTFFGPLDFTGASDSALQVWDSVVSSLAGEGTDSVLVTYNHADGVSSGVDFLNFNLVAPADASFYYQSPYYRIKNKSCISFFYDPSKSVWRFRGLWGSSVTSIPISPHSADIVLYDGITGVLDNFPKAQYTGAFSLSNAVERTLTVKYQYENKTEAASAYVSTVLAGDNYGIQSPVLKGFTASAPVVSGEMPDQDIEVVVIYFRNAYELMIKYFDEFGEVVANDYKCAVLYDHEYVVPSPELEGYTPTEVSIMGRMPDRDINHTVTYIKNFEPPASSSEVEPPSSSSAPELPPGENPYVPWDVELFTQGVRQNYLGNAGTIIDVCLWAFLVITGIYLIIKLGNMLIG